MGKKLVILLLVLALMPFVVSQPPFETNTEGGYQIFYPQFEAVKLNNPFSLHLHVSNISTGLPLTNTQADCKLHLYNSTGSHIFESGVLAKDSNGYDHEIYIQSGNFSDLGRNAFYIWCNSTDWGGEVRGVYEVTSTGDELDIPTSITYASYFGILFVLFGLVLFMISKLPSDNDRDEDGTILAISNLKYLRKTLWLFEWMLVIAIMFLASNLGFAYLGETLFADFFFAIFYIMLALTPLVVILMVMWMIVQIIQDKRMRKLWERGMMGGRM